MKQYTVIGRSLPTEKEPQPELIKMTIFAQNEIVAKSRFFTYTRELKKIKRSGGQIVDIKEKKNNDVIVKNFGVWYKYRSSHDIQNSYREFRAISKADAVENLYQEIAGREKIKAFDVHVLKIKTLSDEEVRSANLKQYMEDVKFPIIRRGDITFRPQFIRKRININA